MSQAKSKSWTVADYERAANRYERRLPLEHYMEGIPQSTQRRITLASLALVEALLTNMQVFNELLVQYFFHGRNRQVVPDNMVRLWRGSMVSSTSYICEFEPVGPFWVMEYVSPSSYRKDYRDNFQKYEHELKVPYYLLFYPERQDLRLYHHTGPGYEQTIATAQGRLALPELELEIGLLDSWARFWFRGELLPLPADMLQQIHWEKQRADQAEQRADQAVQRADQAEQRAGQAVQMADQAVQRADNAEAEVARLRSLLEHVQESKPESGRRHKKK